MASDTKAACPDFGRLAVRREGNYINAYWAAMGTMQDAVLIGSMLIVVADESKELYQRWLDLMRDSMSEGVYRATGIRLTWGKEYPAPEHERAGHG